MPKVKGKEFPYTAEGFKAAAAEKRKTKLQKDKAKDKKG